MQGTKGKNRRGDLNICSHVTSVSLVVSLPCLFSVPLKLCVYPFVGPPLPQYPNLLFLLRCTCQKFVGFHFLWMYVLFCMLSIHFRCHKLQFVFSGKLLLPFIDLFGFICLLFCSYSSFMWRNRWPCAQPQFSHLLSHVGRSQHQLSIHLLNLPSPEKILSAFPNSETCFSWLLL